MTSNAIFVTGSQVARLQIKDRKNHGWPLKLKRCLVLSWSRTTVLWEQFSRQVETIKTAPLYPLHATCRKTGNVFYFSDQNKPDDEFSKSCCGQSLYELQLKREVTLGRVFPVKVLMLIVVTLLKWRGLRVRSRSVKSLTARQKQ